MCRLFGLSGAPNRVRATFWLLDASDSLLVQSHREPDGTGLGHFAADGTPRVEKQPLAAFEDRAFARSARSARSETFVAHIRYASTGGLTPQNTHPFEQRGRLLAHNGVIEDLPALESQLGEYASLVHGETDSERFFALVTKETDAHGGDAGAGLAAAARWVAAHLPLYALNIVLVSATELWALRYPETHGLYVLERAAGAPLRHRGAATSMRVHSEDLAQQPAVVVASEPMDADPAWRQLAAGELLHVDAQGHAATELALERPPRHPLTLSDLGGRAASSQTAHPTGAQAAATRAAPPPPG